MTDQQLIEQFENKKGVTRYPTSRRPKNSLSFPISKGRGSVWNSTRRKAISKNALDPSTQYK
jgi:hypothetical protein